MAPSLEEGASSVVGCLFGSTGTLFFQEETHTTNKQAKQSIQSNTMMHASSKPKRMARTRILSDKNMGSKSILIVQTECTMDDGSTTSPPWKQGDSSFPHGAEKTSGRQERRRSKDDKPVTTKPDHDGDDDGNNNDNILLLSNVERDAEAASWKFFVASSPMYCDLLLVAEGGGHGRNRRGIFHYPTRRFLPPCGDGDDHVGSTWNSRAKSENSGSNSNLLLIPVSSSDDDESIAEKGRVDANDFVWSLSNCHFKLNASWFSIDDTMHSESSSPDGLGLSVSSVPTDDNISSYVSNVNTQLKQEGVIHKDKGKKNTNGSGGGLIMLPLDASPSSSSVKLSPSLSVSRLEQKDVAKIRVSFSLQVAEGTFLAQRRKAQQEAAGAKRLLQKQEDERKRREEERKRQEEARKRQEEEAMRDAEDGKREQELRELLEEGRKKLEDMQKLLVQEKQKLEQELQQQKESHEQEDLRKLFLAVQRSFSTEQSEAVFKNNDHVVSPHPNMSLLTCGNVSQRKHECPLSPKRRKVHVHVAPRSSYRKALPRDQQAMPLDDDEPMRRSSLTPSTRIAFDFLKRQEKKLLEGYLAIGKPVSSHHAKVLHDIENTMHRELNDLDYVLQLMCGIAVVLVAAIFLIALHLWRNSRKTTSFVGNNTRIEARDELRNDQNDSVSVRRDLNEAFMNSSDQQRTLVGYESSVDNNTPSVIFTRARLDLSPVTLDPSLLFLAAATSESKRDEIQHEAPGHFPDISPKPSAEKPYHDRAATFTAFPLGGPWLHNTKETRMTTSVAGTDRKALSPCSKLALQWERNKSSRMLKRQSRRHARLTINPSGFATASHASTWHQGPHTVASFGSASLATDDGSHATVNSNKTCVLTPAVDKKRHGVVSETICDGDGAAALVGASDTTEHHWIEMPPIDNEDEPELSEIAMAAFPCPDDKLGLPLPLLASTSDPKNAFFLTPAVDEKLHEVAESLIVEDSSTTRDEDGTAVFVGASDTTEHHWIEMPPFEDERVIELSEITTSPSPCPDDQMVLPTPPLASTSFIQDYWVA